MFFCDTFERRKYIFLISLAKSEKISLHLHKDRYNRQWKQTKMWHLEPVALYQVFSSEEG